MKVRAKMQKVNREVHETFKPESKKLTKANLDELKWQLQNSLASVKPRFGSDALGFDELVCGFKERIHEMAEDKAWKEQL